MQTIIIAGRVGKDAELRTNGNGDKVLNFSVAVDNGKDANGNKRDATWFDCALWGKRAESLASYIRKGDSICVTGRPTAREHNGKAYLGVNVSELSFMGSASRDNREDSQGQQSSGYGSGGRSGGNDPFDGGDEIPF